MTYFADLTPYSYGAADSSEPGARNIGWLAAGVDFPMASPESRFVDRLWRFCKVSIDHARGLHTCEICGSREANVARREGDELLLGSAEIRVVSSDGQLYAAPNLIYHYVMRHDYSPPEEFIRAVLEGPCPPEAPYAAWLSKLGLTWSNTHVPDRSSEPFRFVKTAQGVVKVEE